MNLAMIYSDLMYVGAPITQVFPPTELTEGGLVVNNEWLIQVTKNKEILLDELRVDDTINPVSAFSTVDDLIKFIMEN
jgi:hypothetical protein